MTKTIKLTQEEITYLNEFVGKGKKSAREITRARILLLVNQQIRDANIQKTLNIGRSTIWRVKMNFLKKGIEYALSERERPGQPEKYNKKTKAEIIALACTTPPKGRKRWSVRLLVEELKKKKETSTINRETIRLILKKTIQNHG